MKTAEQVNANPEAATPMELACASLETLAASARLAVLKNSPAALRETLKITKKVVEMMEGWLDKATH